MVTGKARVGGMGGEQVHAARMRDERPRAIVGQGDQLDDEQPKPCAQPGRDRGAPHARQPLSASEHAHEHEHPEEQRLGRLHIGQQRVLERVVVPEERVDRVRD